MTVAIIQARMGSTRLPGKVLKTVAGVPLLKYQVERVKRAQRIDKFVIATSLLGQDDLIEDFCIENGIECFRGSENDLIDRYYECAKNYGATTIVRLTADCPLADPDVIDETIRLFKDSGVDYAANTVPPATSTFPDGSDVEVFSFMALERAFRDAVDSHDREHVTFVFWKYGRNFSTSQLVNGKDWSKYRFTVDYEEDYEVVKFLIEEINRRGIYGTLGEIVSILQENPDVMALNSRYHFGIGWEKST